MDPGRLLSAAGATTILGLLVGRAAPRVWLATSLAAAAAALVAAGLVLAGGGDWEWRGTVPLGGEVPHLRLDGVSALFLALLCVAGGSAALYGGASWTDADHPRSAGIGRVWWSALMLSLGLVLVASNGLHFLVAWELFTLSAYFLVTLDRSRPEVREAGWLYLGASHAATLSLFAYFAILAAETGSWDLGAMSSRTELAPLFWLALFGFGLKAGLFPLHVWLPSAHANAPSHVSAMLSGVTIKMGIYGLVRFSGWLPVPAGAAWTVAALGAASAVLGVVFALGQHDLKRLLAYHSVENIGIILLGLGFALVAAGQGDAAWGRLALAGGLLHVWNHGLFKALLFLGAGSIVHATGTREMSWLGGLWRRLPWTTALFALGAAAICGLPPLNGFVSEWLVLLGLLDATIARGPGGWAAAPAAILLGATGALALACFVKVCGVVLLGAPRSEACARAEECGPAMRSAMLLLAAGCLAIGLLPAIFWPAVARAVGSWSPAWAGEPVPTALRSLGVAQAALALLAILAAAGLGRRARDRGTRRAPTWDCGYAAPASRMQYTAGSFAATITEWFGWILRPERRLERPEVPFPVAASFAEHTPETVLERVVEPAGDVVLRGALAARRLQHGGVQAYVLYLLIGIAALAGLVLAGGSR